MHPRAGYLFADAAPSTVNASSSRLLDGMAFHSLHQINPVCNPNGRFLDLIFANQHVLPDCSVSIAPDPLCNVDIHHPPLMIAVNRTIKALLSEEFDSNGFDFRRGDYDAINTALCGVDWTSIMHCSDVNEAVSMLIQKVHEVILTHVPIVRSRPKPTWDNRLLTRLNRKRKSALRIYQKNKNPVNRIRFTSASRSYKALNRRLYRMFVHKTERNLRSNPKSFWRFVNGKRKEDGLPSSMFLQQEEAFTNSSKCELFAKHFASVFNSECASTENIAAAMEHVPCDMFTLGVFNISDVEVGEAIRNMKQSYRPGPDGIPAVLLKRCLDTLKLPLAAIFNASLRQQQFPYKWKESFMFPVFKKGDRRNVEQYRGISTLCACSKVFEAVIFAHLMFSVKNYISTAQHGFYPGRSVSTNLLEFTSFCLRGMDNSLQIDAVYTDLKAAFDRVDHGILCAKCDKLGVSDAIVKWLESYLRNRQTAVKLGASQSSWFGNNSGVPQGSILGPLLFSLFINDISRLLPPGTRLLYADDTKIYKLIRNYDDCSNLQTLVNLFADWCRCNYMVVSITKCSVISFHRKKQPLLYDYCISGISLQRSELVTDLGVVLDAQLSFRQHYSMIINKANRQLGLIMRIGKEFIDPGTLRTLYCSLVRSILESACVVWDPHYDYWVQRIERIQRHFVRRICLTLPWRNPENLPSYENLCLLLGIESLEQRRKDIIAKTAHKILTGCYDCPTILSTLQLYCPLRPQRHQRLLEINMQRTNYGQYEPIRRLALVYNRPEYSFNF